MGMGYFPVQNYGEDFNKSLTGMGNFVLGMQKAGDDQAQRQFENGRKVEADKRAQTQLDDSLATNKVTRETHQVDLDQKKYIQDQAKTFDSIYAITQKKAADPAYQYSDEDLKVAGKSLGLTQGLPNDPAKLPQAAQDMETVLQGSDQLRNLNPGTYLLRRGEAPQADSTIASYERLLGDKRFGGVHVDDAGTVTGTPGAKYTTTRVGGIGVDSGPGQQAGFVPMFEIADAQGKTITDATGKPKLVPSTVDESNDPKAPLNVITHDKLQMMVGARVPVMQTVQDMIAADSKNRDKIMQQALEASQSHEDKEKAFKSRAAAAALEEQLPNMTPAQQLQSNTAIGFLKSGGAKSVEEALKLSAMVKPVKQGVALPEGSIYIDPTTGAPIGPGNPKEEKDFAKTVTAGVGGGMERTFQWNNDTRKFDIPIGKPTAKHAPKDTSGADKEELLTQRNTYQNINQSKADYDKRRSDYNKRLATATPDDYKELSAEAQNLEQDRLSIRGSMELYNGKYGKAFALQGEAPAPASGMSPAAQQRPAPVAQPAAPAAPAPSSPAPVFAVNPATKQRIMSTDGGRSWRPAQ